MYKIDKEMDTVSKNSLQDLLHTKNVDNSSQLTGISHSDIDNMINFRSIVANETSRVEAIALGIVKYFVNLLLILEISQSAIEKCLLFALLQKNNNVRGGIPDHQNQEEHFKTTAARANWKSRIL